MGFAPTASSLARKRSTAELHPHIFYWGPQIFRMKIWGKRHTCVTRSGLDNLKYTKGEASGDAWRPRAGSNRRIRVLQTLALPLGYVALFFPIPLVLSRGL
jgi:hypothetical protein